MAQLVDIMSGTPNGFPGRRRRQLAREASLGGGPSTGEIVDEETATEPEAATEVEAAASVASPESPLFDDAAED